MLIKAQGWGMKEMGKDEVRRQTAQGTGVAWNGFWLLSQTQPQGCKASLQGKRLSLVDQKEDPNIANRHSNLSPKPGGAQTLPCTKTGQKQSWVLPFLYPYP